MSPSGYGRALWLLCAAQAVAAIGMAAGGAAGSLLGHDLSSSPAMAELPLGMVVVGATAAVPLVSGVMRQLGRRAGLLLGLAIATGGAAVVVAGAGWRLVPLVLAGNAVMGAGNTAVMLGRYAAADFVAMHRAAGAADRQATAVPAGVTASQPAVPPVQPDHRGAAQAVGAALTAIAIGAVLGPNLLSPSGAVASRFGLPASAGLYLLAIPAFLAAAGLVFFLPRTKVSAALVDQGPESPWGRVPLLVLVVLGSANATMVTLMAFAPVQMHAHGRSLVAVGVTVSLHIAAMFAASPLSGALCARHDPRLVAVSGALLSVVAAAGIGLLAPAGLLYPGALIVLGLGWNLQIVAGTTVLIITAPRRIRHHAEALGEITMGVPAVVASFAAGPLLAFAGTPGLASAVSLVGGGVALRLLLHRKRSIPEDPPVLPAAAAAGPAA